MVTISEPATDTLYLIYDGDCVLCRNTAQATKIKKSVGHLEIINARTSHPLVTEAIKNGYNLNEGIIVKYNKQYFYGVDAVHFLALIGSSSDVYNKINSSLFRYKFAARIFYPLFKAIRKLILFIRRIPPIAKPMQKPLIEKIYGEQAQEIPKILRGRYSNRPCSNDRLLLKGEMNISISWVFCILSPLFRLAGAFAPYPAEKIPVTVECISDEKSDLVLMHRTFYYPDKSPYHFRSRILHIKENIVVELLHFGFATKLIYSFNKNKIIIDFGGYVFCLGKRLIPIPLGFLIGKIYAFEEAVSVDQFNMQVKIVHPLFGKIFQYDGYFKIATS